MKQNGVRKKGQPNQFIELIYMHVCLFVYNYVYINYISAINTHGTCSGVGMRGSTTVLASPLFYCINFLHVK